MNELGNNPNADASPDGLGDLDDFNEVDDKGGDNVKSEESEVKRSGRGKERATRSKKGKKSPLIDIYAAMLVVAFLAVTLATVLLILEFRRYNFKQQPEVSRVEERMPDIGNVFGKSRLAVNSRVQPVNRV